MSHKESLKAVRSHELSAALHAFLSLRKGARCRTLLETGVGTGQQAKMLQECDFDVVAVDLLTSHCRFDRVFDVIEYDGHTIPRPTGSLDVVFSSPFLAHVYYTMANG